MKKIALATALLAAASGTAYAQSSVTLYGLVDNGLNFINNVGGKRSYVLTSSVGQIQGSRWGLRATEDLGGGLSAIAQLENGFDTDTGKFGQNGLEFGRLAIVGLSGPYGKITAGRQYPSVVDFVGANLIPSGIWGGTFAAHAGDVDNLNDSFRANNALKYTSVNYHGFTFGGLYSFGGQAGAFNKNSGFGGGASYAGGPLKLGVAFTSMQDPYTSAYNNGANAPAAQQSPIFSGYMSAHSLQIFAAAGLYTIGAATIGANYTNSRFKGLGEDTGNLGAVAGLAGEAVFNNFEANFAYMVTPAVSLFAAYNFTTRSTLHGDGGAHYNQGAIGADYRLSKRTDLYFSAVYQKAAGRDSTGAVAVAALDGSNPSSNNHQAAMRIAIRHLF